jgi:hypothetical protein
MMTPHPVKAVAMAEDSRLDNRTNRRSRVLKGGKIIFGVYDESVIDCLILDESPSGARVQTELLLTLPDVVKLRFQSGATYSAVCSWTRGKEIGFKFIGADALSKDGAKQAQVTRQILHDRGMKDALAHLASVRYFDDHEFRRLAEDAVATQARFVSALEALAAGRRVPNSHVDHAGSSADAGRASMVDSGRGLWK